MYYFVDIVCSFAEVIFLSFLASSFFSWRSNHIWIKTLTYTFFIFILLALSFIPGLTSLRTLFWIVGGTILIKLIFDAKLLSSFFACVSYIVISGLTDIAVMVFLSFFNLGNQELMEVGAPRTLYTTVSHIVQLLLIVAIRFIKGISTGRLSAKVLLPVCPCLVVSILFCCLLASDISRHADMNPFYLIVAIGLLYTCIVVILYTTWLQNQQNARHNLELANHHYAMQKEYYEQLHSQQEQVRALWHDISKYLRAIEADSTAEASLIQLQNMVNSVTDVVDVNNRVVSIILNEYIQTAKESDVTLTLDVQVPQELPITAADLYIILGNTLDNSLAACSVLPKNERHISFQLRLHNEMLFYRISNPYSDNHPKRKRNQFHGYGLKNVQECVNRNSGTLEISSADNTYVVTALIMCH